tara:strand:+ start:435 stop:548 length:114 start_codon:yes stop_codon:yes gene_type:complete
MGSGITLSQYSPGMFLYKLKNTNQDKNIHYLKKSIFN